jgi:glycosyltransferase involved in cell wall biosynthesis
LCWSSPLPPTRSGIADYAVELVPELARLAEVVVVEPPGQKAGAGAWSSGLERVAADRPAPTGTVELLHLGNNPYHLWVARRLRDFGGIAVLHDTVLHHLLVEEAAADGDWSRFESELELAYGRHGAALAAARRWGLAGRRDPFLFPARQVYLRLARGVIVHSERAARDVAAELPALPVRRVPLAVAALPAGDRARTRRALGVGDSELLLLHLGFLTEAKAIATVLRALLALVELDVGFRLVLVGEGDAQEATTALVGRLGLAGRVRLAGYAAPDALGAMVAAADLGLVPRFPTAGETSAAALRFLAAGTPVLVSGHAQFLELPADAALRVAPGRAGTAELVRHIAGLAASGQARGAARTAARRAWENGGHDPARAAAALLAAVRDLGRGLA